MVTDSTGNMFQGGHQALVCPVNMVGTMGNGLAAYFKQRYPGLDDIYQEACRHNRFKDHHSVITEIGDLKVILLPTKVHWRANSKLSWINAALRYLAAICKEYQIEDIGMPAIGCGKGMLDWDDVRYLIGHYFADHPTRVTAYSPK